MRAPRTYSSLLLAAVMAWPLASQAANKLPKLKPFSQFIGTTSKGERILNPLATPSMKVPLATDIYVGIVRSAQTFTEDEYGKSFVGQRIQAMFYNSQTCEIKLAGITALIESTNHAADQARKDIDMMALRLQKKPDLVYKLPRGHNLEAPDLCKPPVMAQLLSRHLG